MNKLKLYSKLYSNENIKMWQKDKKMNTDTIQTIIIFKYSINIIKYKYSITITSYHLLLLK